MHQEIKQFTSLSTAFVYHIKEINITTNYHLYQPVYDELTSQLYGWYDTL
jgi:hypothetical protein